MVFDSHFAVLALKPVHNTASTVESNELAVPTMVAPCHSHDLSGCVDFAHKFRNFLNPNLHFENGIW